MSSNSRKSTGYDSLVDTATRVAGNLSIKQQHELVLVALDRAFPAVILSFVSSYGFIRSTSIRN